MALNLKDKSKPKPQRGSSQRATSFIGGPGRIFSLGEDLRHPPHIQRFGVEAPELAA